MTTDASVAALQEQRYQLNLRRTQAQADRTELLDRVVTLDSQISGYDVSISALDTTLASVRPVPTLTLLSAASLLRGSVGNELTVTGTGFVSGASQIKLGGAAQVTVVASATSASCDVPDALLEETGSLVVTVVTPGPGGGTSIGLTVQIVNADPVLDEADPATVTAGTEDVVLTLSGSYFYDDSVIYLNGVARATTLVGADLTCAVPDALLATADVDVTIYVVNPAPGGGQSDPLVLPVT